MSQNSQAVGAPNDALVGADLTTSGLRSITHLARPDGETAFEKLA